MQAIMEGDGWWWREIRIGIAYLIGHWAWIVVVALVSLAISAWVRFKPAARGALFGIIFILAGFAQAINAVTNTSIGDLNDGKQKMRESTFRLGISLLQSVV